MAKKTPYTNYHDLNLDWIVKKIKSAINTAYNPDNPPPYPVTSVNGYAGAVQLDSKEIPYINGQPETVWDEVHKRYVKPASGIPAHDLADTYIESPAIAGNAGQVLTSDGHGSQSWQTPVSPDSIIDDNAGYGDTGKTWSADKLTQVEADIIDLQNDKLDAPYNTGNYGDVLITDKNLNTAWSSDLSETGENLLKKIYYYGFASGKLLYAENCRCYIVPVTGNTKYTIKRYSTTSPDRLRVGFLKTEPANNVDVYSLRGIVETINSFARGLFDDSTEVTFTVPDECIYCVVYYSNMNNDADATTQLRLVVGETAPEWSQFDGVTAVDVVARYGINDIIKRNNPISMLEKLQQLNRPTRTGSQTLGTPPLCMLHFSDIHGDEYCLKNITDFYNYYKIWISDVIQTGDLVTTYSGNGIDFYTNNDTAKSFLGVIGNHDYRTSANNWSGKQSAQESRTMYFDPFLSNWNVNINNDVCYYYKDYSTNNIRLIVLDSMHDDATQQSWFATTINDAITLNLHVIVAVHHMPSKNLTPFTTPWDDKPAVAWYQPPTFPDLSDNNYPQWLDDSYITTVSNFQNNNGNFVCWLFGHIHCAMFAKITNTNQLCVGVGNAGGPDFAWTYANARHQGTKSADDFNIFAVDTDSKVLKIAKVGVDYNRLMMHKNVISYDYENGTIIADQ